MIRRPPRSTRTDTLFPYTTLFRSFTNPLLSSGPDPWITQVDGVYYYTHTLGDRLMLWRTDNIADLAKAEKRVVWKPPAKGPNAHSIWAPELPRIDGKRTEERRVGDEVDSKGRFRRSAVQYKKN